MHKAPESRDEELYRRVDEVLHYIWDPVQIAGVPTARNEYSAYLPQIFGLVRDGAGIERVADYLAALVTERMELTGTNERALRAASVLVDWRERLESKYEQMESYS